MPLEEPDFDKILSSLSQHNVKYVLIGGLAMILHGSAHVTQDLDISYARDDSNLSLLAAALKEQNARLRGVPDDLPFVLDARTFRNVQNLTLTTSLGSLDLLAEPAGVDSFEGLWKRSVPMQVNGVLVHVASVEDLIAMKRAANRPKDQAHLFELESLQRLTAAENAASDDVAV